MTLVKNVLKIVVAGAAAATLGGCWVHYHYRHGPPLVGADLIYIRTAPPPPHHYRTPPRPIAGAVWIDGYWRWSGYDYVWVDGFWDRNPPAGRVWAPGRWVHTNRGWYWTPGRWK